MSIFWRMGTVGLWEIHDQAFPLDPFEQLKTDLYTWNDKYATGFPNPLLFHLWPRDVFRAVLALMQIPPSVIQRLLLVFGFMLSGFGMYYLSNLLFKRRSSGMISATLYMINPVIGYWLFLGAYGPLYSYSVTPLFVGLLIKTLKQTTQGLRVVIGYLGALALVSTFLLTSMPEVSVIVLLLTCAMVVYYVIINYKRGLAVQGVILSSLTLAFLIFASNSYWILPVLADRSSWQFLTTSISHPNLQKLNFLSSYPLLTLQSLRLQIFMWNSDFIGNPVREWISAPGWIIYGIIFTVITFVPLLLKPRSRDLILLGTVTVVSIGLAQGIYGPLGSLYQALFNFLPLFSALTDPFKFLFISIIGYSALLGSLASRSWVKRCKRKFLIIMILTLVFINGFPLISGNFYGTLSPVVVPTYYTETAQRLGLDSNNLRVLMVPQSLIGYNVVYNWSDVQAWDPYSMLPISLHTFPNAVFDWIIGDFYVHPALADTERIVEAAYKALLENQTGVMRFLELLNIGYILVSQDIKTTQNYSQNSVQKVKDFLEKNLSLRGEQFGNLIVYKLPYADSLIRGVTTYFIFSLNYDDGIECVAKYGVYINSYALLISNEESVLPKEVLEVAHHVDKPADCVTMSETTKLNATSSNTLVQLVYRKLSPTRYEIHVNSTLPFVLVLKETFDPDWVAYLDGKVLDNHFKVDFYANGWFIDNTGAHNVVIEYLPQKAYTVGIFTSAVAITIDFVLVLANLRKSVNRINATIKR